MEKVPKVYSQGQGHIQASQLFSTIKENGAFLPLEETIVRKPARLPGSFLQ